MVGHVQSIRHAYVICYQSDAPFVWAQDEVCPARIWSPTHEGLASSDVMGGWGKHVFKGYFKGTGMWTSATCCWFGVRPLVSTIRFSHDRLIETRR